MHDSACLLKGDTAVSVAASARNESVHKRLMGGKQRSL
jgi:hypothetical protein